MNPSLVVLVLGAGAVAVWYLTRGNAQGSTGYQPPSTPAVIHQNTPAPIQGNSGTSWNPGDLGALAGNGGGPDWLGPTLGIAGAIASVGLLIWNMKRNTTFDARKEFAEKLGFGNDRAAYDSLLETLRFIGRDDLAHTALNIIGRKDDAANQRWMQNVLDALQGALNAGTWNGQPVPVQGTASGGFWGRS